MVKEFGLLGWVCPRGNEPRRAGVMEHHRCAHCRNPIRHGNGLSTPSAGPGESWFHHDCWAAVLSAKQEDYHRRIQARGIDALIAPYVLKAPASATVVKLVVAQAKPPDIETFDSHRPVDSRKPVPSSQSVESREQLDESDTA